MKGMLLEHLPILYVFLTKENYLIPHLLYEKMSKMLRNKYSIKQNELHLH